MMMIVMMILMVPMVIIYESMSWKYIYDMSFVIDYKSTVF